MRMILNRSIPFYGQRAKKLYIFSYQKIKKIYDCESGVFKVSFWSRDEGVNPFVMLGRKLSETMVSLRSFLGDPWSYIKCTMIGEVGGVGSHGLEPIEF